MEVIEGVVVGVASRWGEPVPSVDIFEERFERVWSPRGMREVALERFPAFLIFIATRSRRPHGPPPTLQGCGCFLQVLLKKLLEVPMRCRLKKDKVESFRVLWSFGNLSEVVNIFHQRVCYQSSIYFQGTGWALQGKLDAERARDTKTRLHFGKGLKFLKSLEPSLWNYFRVPISQPRTLFTKPVVLKLQPRLPNRPPCFSLTGVRNLQP